MSEWTAPLPKRRKNSREKGARGERYVVGCFRALMEKIEIEVSETHGIQVDHSTQVRRTAKPRFSKGRDLEGIPLLCIEVKNVSANLINAHWAQTLKQQLEPPHGRFPVLIFNRLRSWHVRTYASLQSPQQSEVMQWIVCDYDFDQFLQWYGEVYREFITR